MTTALYIGRFQPLHNGHIIYIKNMLKENDKLIIVIGSAQEKNTDKNPFSVRERKKMLKLCFKHEHLKHIKIISQKDYPNDNQKWLMKVLKKTGKFDNIYAGENQLVRKIFTDEGYEVKIFRRIQNISSTRIRDLIAKNKVWKHLVPQSVYNYITSINGATRIRNI